MKLMRKHIFMTGDKNKIGFTLVELLVVLFLLSTVMIIISSVATQAFAVQRRSLQFQQVEENIRIIIESIAKELRVSDLVPGEDTCNDAITMNHPSQGSIGYFIENGQLIRVDSEGSTSVINSNTIEFTYLSFCTRGLELNDNRQPRVLMNIGVKNKEGRDDIVIDLQTTISLRKLID